MIVNLAVFLACVLVTIIGFVGVHKTSCYENKWGGMLYLGAFSAASTVIVTIAQFFLGLAFG